MLFFCSDRHCQEGHTKTVSGHYCPRNKLMEWANTTVIRFEDRNLYFGSTLHHVGETLLDSATDTHFVLKPKTILILTQE